jgi:outer membrane protein TolC
MDGANRPRLPELPRLPASWKWLGGLAFRGCMTGMPLLAIACGQFNQSTSTRAPEAMVARATSGDRADVTVLPPPEEVQPAAPSAQTAPADGKLLPINLDTVFRLAEDQNSQVGVARARVEEAWAAKDVADMSWLPSLNVGTLYFRHEGGIANENGTITRSSFGLLFGGLEITSRLDLREAVYIKVNAERQLWQQRGELRRVTSETLLDAATTYIDLLAARNAEAIVLEQLKELDNLYGRADRLADPAKGDPGARVEAVRIRVQQRAFQRRLASVREQAKRASAKLAYLLGVDPDLTLVPVDQKLAPLRLVDVSPAVNDLVAQALRSGPGIQEMEGLLALIHESMAKACGPGKYLPVLEMRMIEGGFGTGPGDSMTWDNRWDLGLQARWNLMEWVTAHDRQRVLEAKTEQAHLAFQDLRGKLTAGVKEAREAIVGGQEQIHLAQEQVNEARRVHDLSEKRVQNLVQGSSYSEVLLSLVSVAGAQASYLNAVRDYDQAQIRLLILLGTAAGRPANGDCPNLPCQPQ